MGISRLLKVFITIPQKYTTRKTAIVIFCVGHLSEYAMCPVVSNTSKLFVKFQIHGYRVVRMCMICICFVLQTVERVEQMINLVSTIIRS